MHAGATALVDAVTLEALDPCLSCVYDEMTTWGGRVLGLSKKKRQRDALCKSLCGKIMFDVCCIPTSCDEYIAMVKTGNEC